MNTVTHLVDLTQRLRRLSKAERRLICLDVDDLAAGYHNLCANAPSRKQGYLSRRRLGITSSGKTSNRSEEHLAVGLFNRKELALPNGERLKILDYQFPLKSSSADSGIGKIDLLGLFDDGTLGVIELKTDSNSEDRRIGLMEGLIYASIVEANIEQIASEVYAVHHCRVAHVRPKVLLIAPPVFWSNTNSVPLVDDLQELTDKIRIAIPIDITLLILADAELVKFGRDGDPPVIRGHAFLSTVKSDFSVDMCSRPVSQAAYLGELFRTFWTYRRTSFTLGDDLFEPRYAEGRHPPVFREAHAERNLLMPPAAEPGVIRAIAGAVSPKDRHRAFASMRSSQALAQSFFAGLRGIDRLDALEGLAAEDGDLAFFQSCDGYKLALEHSVSTLNEPRPTSVDAFFKGARSVAVEVKFTEPEFGRCSRPRLRPEDPTFEREYCDGTFRIQRNRSERCSLSEIGIRYWELLPEIFIWKGKEDYRPCPLNPTYQLVRNVLAACVSSGAALDTETGHALVVYDARNPAFHPGGIADAQWWATIRALRYPRLLRRVSWQSIAAHLDQFIDLKWLTQGLQDKYGIRAEVPFSTFSCCAPDSVNIDAT